MINVFVATSTRGLDLTYLIHITNQDGDILNILSETYTYTYAVSNNTRHKFLADVILHRVESIYPEDELRIFTADRESFSHLKDPKIKVTRQTSREDYIEQVLDSLYAMNKIIREEEQDRWVYDI